MVSHWGAQPSNNAFGNTREDLYMGSLFDLSPVEVSKALATTGAISTNVDGSGLIGYHLDKVIRFETLDEENNLPKLRRFHTEGASALSNEWITVSSRGNLTGNFRSEGQFGRAESTRPTRNSVTQKYMGRLGGVTRELQAAVGGSLGDAKAFEMSQQLIAFLHNLERDIWHSSSTLNPIAFDGVFAQMDSSTEFNIDRANTSSGKVVSGGDLPLSVIRALLHKANRYGGVFSCLYCAPQERTGFGTEVDQFSRYYKQDQMNNLGRGLQVDQLANEYGKPVDIIWDLTLGGINGHYDHIPNNPGTASLFHSDAPAQPPAMTTANPAAASGGYLPDDTYYYGVSFVGEAGEGPIRLHSTGAATSSTNNTVNVTVDLPATTPHALIRSIRLYRSTTNGTDYTKMRLVKEVALTGAASGTQVIADDGSRIPGSREAALVVEKSACLIALETPVVADIPRRSNIHEFSIDAIGTCALKVDKHVIRFYNIGGSVEDPA